MIKLAVVTSLFVGAAIALIWGVQNYLNIDDLQNCSQPDVTVAACAPADAIVAISGGDTQARASEAIKLYQAGWAPTLVFSGAAFDTTGPSNAQAMRTQAVKDGVPESAIVIDSAAIDTVANARNTSKLLLNAKRIVLVTSPYHQHRASLEFQKFFGDSVTIVNHPTSTDRLWPSFWWTTLSGWWLALSECVKTLVVAVQS